MSTCHDGTYRHPPVTIELAQVPGGIEWQLIADDGDPISTGNVRGTDNWTAALTAAQGALHNANAAWEADRACEVSDCPRLDDPDGVTVYPQGEDLHGGPAVLVSHPDCFQRALATGEAVHPACCAPEVCGTCNPVS